MHFSRLRLQGFKSFVEPTDLYVQPGLTGIVGPNGCGKSNLVEALRWVMGENSAKRMRGAEMDDVIFAGTATRPSRNVAEVMLELDNSSHTAPSEFNNDEKIQVTRQIERGNGSDYRLNGKPVRQRDVQLLFADQATGAHSTNLVGQGQIDALIRAKPQDRRQILEEASGTAGLHARRHEAELKLKAAEQNLIRVDDVLATYDSQLRSLKQQVRQASRYRNLADHIRRTEAAILHLRWIESEHNAENVQKALQIAEQSVNEFLVVVTQTTTLRTNITSELPGLRQTEAVAAAVVQKLSLAREQIEAETKRLAQETEAQENRLQLARQDQAREQDHLTDSTAAIAKLRHEDEQLETTSIALTTQIPETNRLLAEVNQVVDTLDQSLTELTEAVATAEAQKKALHQELELIKTRQSALHEKRKQMEVQYVGLKAEAANRPDLSFASALMQASETELVRRQTQAQTAEEAYRDAENKQTQARTTTQEYNDKVTHLKAEASAILALLQHDDNQLTPVLDLINVTPGLESALAVALGEALTAALDTQAAMHWREMEPLSSPPSLPEGVTSLSTHIEAPRALARSLSQIGLVDDVASGEKAIPHLQAGQILVSRDGWAWRWDGFVVTPEAKTSTALRLQQRNRLTSLQQQIISAELDALNANHSLQETLNHFRQRQEEDRHAREALKAAFAALNDARSAYALQEKEETALTSKLVALQESLEHVNADLNQIQNRSLSILDEQTNLPDIESQRAQMEGKRNYLAEQRSLKARYDNDCERLQRERDICDSRRQSIYQDIEAWQKRHHNAQQQITALEKRISILTEELHQLHQRPEELKQRYDNLLSELSNAESVRKLATDDLIATEQRLSVVEHQLKQDETALAVAREERVRAEASVQSAHEHFNTLRERITEKLGCTQEELLSIAAFPEGENIPSVFELDQALARYLRERENMGPVNLRAETEAETLQSTMETLQKERDDLVAAIAKLRQGIGQLNREARERLQNAFSLVNERFQVLFQKLFNGGRAHLELIDNDDPLNAGLEIFASPPGKKMQILSLLSGGERTLTALALLFAVFQTNPSPICVLDEAEAALDESNIGRFCELVDLIAKETGTRFLIITHQRLTMARMDRLYGVTMGEKGVSQLVSVDLAGAVAIRDGENPETDLDSDAMPFKEVQAA